MSSYCSSINFNHCNSWLEVHATKYMKTVFITCVLEISVMEVTLDFHRRLDEARIAAAKHNRNTQAASAMWEEMTLFQPILVLHLGCIHMSFASHFFCCGLNVTCEHTRRSIASHSVMYRMANPAFIITSSDGIRYRTCGVCHTYQRATTSQTTN